MTTLEKYEHKGCRIEIQEIDGEWKVTAKKMDGSIIEHEDNPDFYEDHEDAIEHGKTVIDSLYS